MEIDHQRNQRKQIIGEISELSKTYDPKSVESAIYMFWQKSGYFNPDKLNRKSKIENRKFSILMPPTNANGSLHAGHSLVLTIEDIMIRYKRMRGFKTLWLPGLDHAGFETQVVYEKKLEKEGKSRFKMDPDQLYKEIWDFTQNNKKNIIEQTKKMGASCDWSRLKFTLDPDIIKTVYNTFKKLSDDNLLYRGKRIISWCPKHQTSFADIEIKDEERVEPYYYLKYGPFIISTSRPETKFGDKYVVMHPKDKRYTEYKDGQKINLEWINGPITATIIKDEAVDMKFGTGVMTITPWHDPVDFEIAARHSLEKEQIIDENGKLLSIAGEFAEMHIKKARPLIIEKLKAKGLVEKVDENYKHVVHTCYKCGATIEPQIQNQWFVKMKPLAEKALRKINVSEITYIPEHYKKITIHWLKNIIDWNISRQIVWGIPIPAKICDKCEKGFVDLEDKIKKCDNCGGKIRKDNDTFDTWFSSAQWPFATLGYPDGKDFKEFYPTDVLETAGDIFHWVARMIMLGLYITGKLPFSTVYMHGMVLDAKGQKMSKSKGNVINPLDITDKYGTDALRIGLVIGNTPGTSLALDENRIKGYKFFANKVWNASRFVLLAQNTRMTTNDNTNDHEFITKKSKANNQKLRVTSCELQASDQKDLDEFKKLCASITKDMDNFKFYIAAEKIYHYFWHTFCDKIIENSKQILADGSDQEKISVQYKLLEILQGSLKLLHPFMPFITEEIYQNLRLAISDPSTKLGAGKRLAKSIMISDWPK